MITVGIDSSRANALACSRPPPPAEQYEFARIEPVLDETVLIARPLMTVASETMPSAIRVSPSAPGYPSGSAMRCTACRAADASSLSSPPRNRSGLSRPSTRLASVTVGSLPPLP
jgi:hypothetical protein